MRVSFRTALRLLGAHRYTVDSGYRSLSHGGMLDIEYRTFGSTTHDLRRELMWQDELALRYRMGPEFFWRFIPCTLGAVLRERMLLKAEGRYLKDICDRIAKQPQRDADYFHPQIDPETWNESRKHTRTGQQRQKVYDLHDARKAREQRMQAVHEYNREQGLE